MNRSKAKGQPRTNADNCNCKYNYNFNFNFAADDADDADLIRVVDRLCRGVGDIRG